MMGNNQIRGIDNLYIRNKLDLIESTLQLIHNENVALAKVMCGSTQNAQEVEQDWNERFDSLIRKYKEKTEGVKDANQV